MEVPSTASSVAEKSESLSLTVLQNVTEVEHFKERKASLKQRMSEAESKPSS